MSSELPPDIQQKQMTQKSETQDSILIKGLTISCLIGIYPDELTTKQPVVCDLEIGLDLSLAGRSGRISDTCDYGIVANEVTALMQFRKYGLLENAAEELAAMLFGIHKNILTLVIRIQKPRALKGKASVAAIEIRRANEHFSPKKTKSQFGEIELLLETRHAVLNLFHIDVHKEISFPQHKKMRGIEWLVKGNVVFNNQALTEFEPAVRLVGQPHSYRNTGDEKATVFSCEMPVSSVI